VLRDAGDAVAAGGRTADFGYAPAFAAAVGDPPRAELRQSGAGSQLSSVTI